MSNGNPYFPVMAIEHDWSGLIRRIESHGLSTIEVARCLDCPYSTITDIRRGASRSPRGMLAVWLHEMDQALASKSVNADQLRVGKWSQIRAAGEMHDAA